MSSTHTVEVSILL